MTYLIIVAIIGLVGKHGCDTERREWNNGICAKTGEPWSYFDSDSSGARGYKSGTHVLWVSYPGIDRK